MTCIHIDFGLEIVAGYSQFTVFRLHVFTLTVRLQKLELKQTHSLCIDSDTYS